LIALLVYCFFFGLLHGILPDEHTWPITFSYAIGSGSGWQGMRAGIYFAAAFTLQRMLMSELSCLALAPFLRSPEVNSFVYVIAGGVMSLAGWILLRHGRYGHFHLLGHHHDTPEEMEGTSAVLTRHHANIAPAQALPVRWTLVHGFVAGFGLGGFALFVNTVAAPAMPSAWLGFLPGLLFGLGTMVTLAAVSAAFAFGLRRMSGLKEQDVLRFGSRAGARVLLAGGFLFMVAGLGMAAGLGRHLPVRSEYVVIALFAVVVVVPALIHAWKELPTPRCGVNGSV
jgi:sulfite exporter TauE/SafE